MQLRRHHAIDTRPTLANRCQFWLVVAPFVAALVLANILLVPLVAACAALWHLTFGTMDGDRSTINMSVSASH